jgi:hypothetical protein
MSTYTHEGSCDKHIKTHKWSISVQALAENFKSMPFTRDAMSFLTCHVSVSNMQYKTFNRRNSAIVLNVLYIKFHFSTTNSLEATTNLLQKRRYWHKNLKQTFKNNIPNFIP